MKAVTLWQPWATLVALGVKTIETRSWPAPKSMVGQRIAIHAAKRDQAGVFFPAMNSGVHRHLGAGACLYRNADDTHTPLPLGAVVATAELVACLPMIREGGPGCGPQDPYALVINHAATRARVYAELGNVPGVDVTDQLPFGDFAPGRWAWILDHIDRLAEPVPAVGRQGVWEWSAA